MSFIQSNSIQGDEDRYSDDEIDESEIHDKVKELDQVEDPNKVEEFNQNEQPIDFSKFIHTGKKLQQFLRQKETATEEVHQNKKSCFIQGNGKLSNNFMDKILKSLDIDLNNTKNQAQANLILEQQLLVKINKEVVDIKEVEDQSITITILNKISKSKEELKYLRKVLEGVKLFQQRPELLDSNNFYKIIDKSLTHRHYRKHETIFREGNDGVEYIIILKGYAWLIQSKNLHQNVTTPPPKDDDEIKEDFYEPCRKNPPPYMKNKIDKMTAIDWSFLKKKYAGQVLLNIFTCAESFGEIALMNIDGGKRTGTVICRENTDVMILDKHGFNAILGSYYDTIDNENLNFLKSFSFFSQIGNTKLLQMIYDMQIKKLNGKTILYCEKDQANNLYLIRKGEVEISQVFDLDTKGVEEGKHVDEDDLNILNKIKLQKDRSHFLKRISLGLYGPSSIVGNLEICGKLAKRCTQAITTQDSLIYQIDKSKLIPVLKSWNQYDKFIKDYKVKHQFQIRRIEKIISDCSGVGSHLEFDKIKQQLQSFNIQADTSYTPTDFLPQGSRKQCVQEQHSNDNQYKSLVKNFPNKNQQINETLEEQFILASLEPVFGSIAVQQDLSKSPEEMDKNADFLQKKHQLKIQKISAIEEQINKKSQDNSHLEQTLRRRFKIKPAQIQHVIVPSNYFEHFSKQDQRLADMRDKYIKKSVEQTAHLTAEGKQQTAQQGSVQQQSLKQGSAQQQSVYQGSMQSSAQIPNTPLQNPSQLFISKSPSKKLIIFDQIETTQKKPSSFIETTSKKSSQSQQILQHILNNEKISLVNFNDVVYKKKTHERAKLNTSNHMKNFSVSQNYQGSRSELNLQYFQKKCASLTKNLKLEKILKIPKKKYISCYELSKEKIQKDIVQYETDRVGDCATKNLLNRDVNVRNKSMHLNARNNHIYNIPKQNNQKFFLGSDINDIY